jgi:hypothetical protein
MVVDVLEGLSDSPLDDGLVQHRSSLQVRSSRSTRCSVESCGSRDLLAGHVGCEAEGFFVHVTSEEVAEQAQSAQDCEDGREVDLGSASKVRGRGARRLHFECPSHSGRDRDKMKEVHPACGRVHLDVRPVCADAAVVLDDR